MGVVRKPTGEPGGRRAADPSRGQGGGPIARPSRGRGGALAAIALAGAFATAATATATAAERPGAPEILGLLDQQPVSDGRRYVAVRTSPDTARVFDGTKVTARDLPLQGLCGTGDGRPWRLSAVGGGKLLVTCAPLRSEPVPGMATSPRPLLVDLESGAAQEPPGTDAFLEAMSRRPLLGLTYAQIGEQWIAGTGSIGMTMTAPFAFNWRDGRHAATPPTDGSAAMRWDLDAPDLVNDACAAQAERSWDQPTPRSPPPAGCAEPYRWITQRAQEPDEPSRYGSGFLSRGEVVEGRAAAVAIFDCGERYWWPFDGPADQRVRTGHSAGDLVAARQESSGRWFAWKRTAPQGCTATSKPRLTIAKTIATSHRWLDARSGAQAIPAAGEQPVAGPLTLRPRARLIARTGTPARRLTWRFVVRGRATGPVRHARRAGGRTRWSIAVPRRIPARDVLIEARADGDDGGFARFRVEGRRAAAKR